MSLYDTLGVPPDATDEQIRKAYRREASKHHPDREGGDAAAMQKVNDAYAVLAIPERRKQYDETGTTAPPPTIEEEAREILAQLFNASIEALDKGDGNDLEYNDPVKAVREHVIGVRASNDGVIKQLRRRIAQRKVAIRRLRRKEGSGPDAILLALHGVIGQLEAEVKKADLAQQRLFAVLNLLAEYEYQVDVKPPQPRTIRSMHDVMLEALARQSGTWGTFTPPGV